MTATIAVCLVVTLYSAIELEQWSLVYLHRYRCYSDMCSPGICVPPKGYMFPPRRSDMRSPGICVPPPARASTGQTLASAGRDGSPRGVDLALMDAAGTSQPHAHMYIALVIATVHQYYHMYQYHAHMHGRRDATTQMRHVHSHVHGYVPSSFARSYLSAFRLPLRPSIDVVLFQMEEEKWQAIFNYVAYPAGYSNSQKYVLRRSCKSYVVEGGKRLFSRHL